MLVRLVFCVWLTTTLISCKELPPKWWLQSSGNPFDELQGELGATFPSELASASTDVKQFPSSASANAGPTGRPGRLPPERTTTRPPTTSRRPPTTRPPRFPTGRPSTRPTAGAFGQAEMAIPNAGESVDSASGGPIIFPSGGPAQAEKVDKAELENLPENCVCSPRGACPGKQVQNPPPGRCDPGQHCCPRSTLYQPKCGRIDLRPIPQNGPKPAGTPWAAALLQTVPNGLIFLCGGTLIHPQVVLTAARCVTESGFDEKALRVRLGDHDLVADGQVHPYQEREVAEILVHQNYSRLEKYNDIALLFLDEPVVLREGLDTVCIRRKVAATRGCVTSAYGLRQTEAGDFDLRLKEVTQTPVAYINCQRILRGSTKGPFFALHPTFFCTKSSHLCDLSEDRAGSPTTCPDPRSGEHQLIGLVAWGAGCIDQDKPGVHTSVEDFYDWIDFHVTDHFHYIESYFGFNQV